MRKPIIAWDSCILLDAIQRTPGKYQSIAPMLNLAMKDELKIILSAMSYAECFYLKEQAKVGVSQEGQTDLIERWLENDFLVKRTVDFGVSKTAAQLCRQFPGKLLPPDAIIAATAVVHAVPALITYDKPLLGCDGRIALADGTFLRICRPEAWNTDHSPQLFDREPEAAD